MTTLSVAELPDFKHAPNQGGNIELYEVENRALDPDGHLLAAMRAQAPWAGRTLLDLGCGSGYWLSGYADEAAEVIGVEPDPRLLPLAAGRDPRARVLHGSAEHIPLPERSVDVVHARFAYFFPPGCDAGLAEVMRVLRPGGTLIVIGNDVRAGEFAELLRAAEGALVPGGGAETDAWWAARGADRVTVRSRWRFQSRADFEAVLRMEFPLKVADPWLAAHPGALGLSYSYTLFAIGKPAGLLRAR
jgi:SAM-dependent methyltransferase